MGLVLSQPGKSSGLRSAVIPLSPKHFPVSSPSYVTPHPIYSPGHSFSLSLSLSLSLALPLSSPPR